MIHHLHLQVLSSRYHLHLMSSEELLLVELLQFILELP
jgi:hypothetical protein